MCYSLLYKAKLKELKANFDVDIDSEFLEQSGKRIFPRNLAQVITCHDTKDLFQLREMTYSLVPAWSKEPTVKWASYNARLDRVNSKTGKEEKIFEAPTWREPFQKFHCAVPLTCFFESCREEGLGNGYEVAFSEKNDRTLFAAGIYSQWKGAYKGDQVEIDSFAIITKDPTDFISSVGHDRMPIFLNIENSKEWLQNEFKNPQSGYDFLKTQKENLELKFEKIRPLKGA